MRRRHFLSLSLLLVALAPTRSGRADALAPGTGNAETVSIGQAASVIVLRIGSCERRARFGPLTRIRVGPMQAAVTDLRPGMRVVVRFASSETGRESAMLVSIDARALERPL